MNNLGNETLATPGTAGRMPARFKKKRRQDAGAPGGGDREGSFERFK